MMHTFLSKNRDELIRRCTEKVSRRPKRAATASQLRNCVPMFLVIVIVVLLLMGRL